MTATASLAGLFHALDQCKEPDFALLGIIADALEEAGDERAEGYRWAVEERRWPFVNNAMPDQYFWLSHTSLHEKLRHLNWLDWSLATHWTNLGWYKSITAAFDDLCEMLKKRNAAQPQGE